ncbi:unnamed protein product [Peniophora sp. CBMAI 1063]|nr:unnamed protein product [Peniophora sp. CBMAI 1063]
MSAASSHHPSSAAAYSAASSPSSPSSSSCYTPTSSCSDDSDYIETPVQAPGTHIPDLAVDKVEEDDNPFVFMHVLDSLRSLDDYPHIGAFEPTPAPLYSYSDLEVEMADPNELIHVAVGVHAPRYKFRELPLPSCGDTPPPLLAHGEAEVDEDEWFPMYHSMCETATARTAARAEVDEGDDEWFPMYGSPRKVATARAWSNKRKRGDDAEDTVDPEDFGHDASPSSTKRVRIDAPSPLLDLQGIIAWEPYTAAVVRPAELGFGLFVS